jgi:hypothetical protein
VRFKVSAPARDDCEDDEDDKDDDDSSSDDEVYKKYSSPNMYKGMNMNIIIHHDDSSDSN